MVRCKEEGGLRYKNAIPRCDGLTINAVHMCRLNALLSRHFLFVMISSEVVVVIFIVSQL